MIASAKFSFVRFEHPTDNDYSLDIPYSLPAFDKHNVAFQFVVDEDRAIDQAIKLGVADESGALITDLGINASIVSYKYHLALGSSFLLSSITVGGDTKSYSIPSCTLSQFQQIMLDDFGIEMSGRDFYLSDNVTVSVASGLTTITATKYWHQGFVSVTDVDIEQDCFTYALLNSDSSVLAYSNCFRVVDEEEFTSLCTYYCNEDGFEFYYEDETKANVIRLPFHLTQPQFPKSRTVDRKSDGSKRVLSSFVEKEYQIQTEQMPEVFHECMAIMLSHDNISIHNVNIREVDVDVVESDNYNPKWDIEEGTEKQLPWGKATGKVKVANYGYANSNC